MSGVQQRLQPLQPVGVQQAPTRDHMSFGQAVELEVGETRGRRLLAEVDPDQAPGLVHRMAAYGHEVCEPLAPVGRLGGRIDASAVHAHLPAMEDAAQAIAFVAGQRHGGAAMRAGLGDQRHAPVRSAEGDEVLADQPHPLRGAFRLQPG